LWEASNSHFEESRFGARQSKELKAGSVAESTSHPVCAIAHARVGDLRYRQIVIRPAVPADAAAIASMIRELAAFEHLEHEVQANEDNVRDQLFAQPTRPEVIIADDAGDPVGYAVYFRTFSTFVMKPGIFLEDLYVRSDRRGRGWGSALLGAVASIAVESGSGRCEWMALDWNVRAHDFYVAHGAKRLDDWRMYRIMGNDLVRLASGRSPGT